MKKLISLLLVLAMLVPFSPAKAVADTPAIPTVEEILNEYHDKAFEASQQDENRAATNGARSGDSKTLEQQTVEQLTAAGYEAYHITGENYNTIADTLNTDFSAMGLDPEGSYIVVISDVPPGESPDSSAGNNSRNFDPPVMDDLDGGLGEHHLTNAFEYRYDKKTYLMRYVTITPTTSSDMIVDSIYTIQPQYWVDNLLRNVKNTALVTVIDSLTEFVPFGTIAELISDGLTDYNYIELQNNTLTIHANTTWTCNLIQVWEDPKERWVTAQCSEYTVSKAFCAGYRLDSSTGETVQYIGPEYRVNNYSPDFYDYAKRKLEAIKSFIKYTIELDYIYNVKFYLGDKT